MDQEDLDLLKSQRALVESTFTRARDYTNLLLGAGYAGFFGLWGLTKASLTPLTVFLSGALISLSLASFIAWELYNVWFNSRSSFRLGAAVSDPDRLRHEILSHNQESQRRIARLAVIHPKVFAFTIATGFGAMATLFSAFLHGLWLELLKTVRGTDVWTIGTSASIVLGIAIGLITFWLLDAGRQWRQTRNARRNIANVLASDMRATDRLIIDLRREWAADKIVNMLTLREIFESRSEYPNIRPHLSILGTEVERENIRSYYRKTSALLDELNFMQKERLAKLRTRDGLESAITLSKARLATFAVGTPDALNLQASIDTMELDKNVANSEAISMGGAMDLVFDDLDVQREFGLILATSISP